MNSIKSLFTAFIKGSVSLENKINFARHLSIVVRAGLPILEGLRIIRKQTENRRLLVIIDNVIKDVSNGQFLATSLSRYPDVFDNFFVNVVRVGETSGTLADNLLYLAEELKKSRLLKNKIRSAMVYPFIIMIATTALVSFLIFFAFPKILPLFASLKIPLPLPTRILIAVSSFLIANGLWVLVFLAFFALGIKILFLVPAVRYIFDRMALSVPVISKIVINMNMSNITRVLAVLLKGGIHIVEALVITSQTIDNLVYRREMVHAAEEVKKGEQLAMHLAARRKIFPLLLSGLIEIGENTGNLEENLAYLADYYKTESETKIEGLTILVEPMLLLSMGLLVGFVAISIITPIYQITQGV